jgi:hypothetical protein
MIIGVGDGVGDGLGLGLGDGLGLGLGDGEGVGDLGLRLAGQFGGTEDETPLQYVLALLQETEFGSRLQGS